LQWWLGASVDGQMLRRSCPVCQSTNAEVSAAALSGPTSRCVCFKTSDAMKAGAGDCWRA